MHTAAHTERQNPRRRAGCARSTSSCYLGPSASEVVLCDRALVQSQSQIEDPKQDRNPELCAVARLRVSSFSGTNRTRNRTRDGAQGGAMSSRERTATSASDQGRLLPLGLDVACARSASSRVCPITRARATETARLDGRTSTPPVRKGDGMAVEIGSACIVCWRAGTDRAHLIDRSLAPDPENDPLRTVRLCRTHHDEYDRHELDLLPYLEPRYRAELATAVRVHGLISTLERVTGRHWQPTGTGSCRFEVLPHA